MKTEWSLSNDKAILNFSEKYYTNYDQMLGSEAFRSLLEHYFDHADKDIISQDYKALRKYFPQESKHDRIQALVRLAKLLTSMDVKELSVAMPDYASIYEDRLEVRRLAESIYKYWRSLERYCVLFDDKSQSGLATSFFMNAKSQFDKLVLNLYREITHNISLSTPAVYRQVQAGTNVGMICKEYIWPIPEGYEKLRGIPFIKNLILETPFITYPKKNTRDGVFSEVMVNPLDHVGLNNDHFYCYPCFVGDLLAFVYVHRDFLTHGVSLANLFQVATEAETAGRKPDLLYVFGGDNHSETPEDVFHHDDVNDMMVGFVSHHDCYDYFGYMKKMMLTLHNVRQIKKGYLPIHGAMVNIVLKDGKRANVCIMGDSGAGKSESIEAFRALAEDHISDMTIIFDDMGTFRFHPVTGEVIGYGTEIGAFVRLDDLDSGYAFKELDRSIFMNPDKVNARLINPVATYKQIMAGYHVDIFVYANNYTALKKGESAIHLFSSMEEAIPVFKEGKRMAKGTTTEKGYTTSYFANPFGPVQKQEETDVLIEKFFERLFERGIKVGDMCTQLGVAEMEHAGPKLAAMDLFEMIRTL